jgi:flavorubredoxin
MGSEQAVLGWCERVAKLDIDMLCPQHGAIYRGADVGRFISWLSELKVGQLRTEKA